MWKNLSNPWKRSFELAWESYKKGTIPIGAVIIDSNGDIISEGRNRIFDKKSTNVLAGTCMAHAEMTAMIQLKEDEHPNVREYILYTTMEPCPMCFGTMIMMNIRNLRYGAKDMFAGAIELKDKIEYTRNKKMNIEKGDDELEVFQLILQTSFECIRNHARLEEILDTWKKTNKHAVELGKQLYVEKYFINAISENVNISNLYDEVISRYIKFNDAAKEELIG